MKIRDVVPAAPIQEGGCVDPMHGGGFRYLSALIGPLRVERLALGLATILLIASVIAGRVMESNIPAILAASGAVAGVVAGRATSRMWLRFVAGFVTLGCLAAALVQWRMY